MNIAVFCGAAAGKEDTYAKDAARVGQWIGENGHHLIYGGGKVGLMEIVADAAMNSGGKATGVMPEFLAARELAHPSLTKLYIVDTMHERKKKMIDLSECFIALPGGPGTLEEITEVISWSRIGQHTNPCIFFNSNGYYDLISSFYTQMVKKDFLTREDRNTLLFSNDLEEITRYIQQYRAPRVREYKIAKSSEKN